MDGRFLAVEFEPSASAKEVLEMVQTKLGLRPTARGTYIFPFFPVPFINEYIFYLVKLLRRKRVKKKIYLTICGIIVLKHFLTVTQLYVTPNPP